MDTSIRRTTAAVFVGGTLLASLLVTQPAFARPEPEPQPTQTSIDRSHCALERIGTQYVTCDDLTGAGAPAPEWVPEQR